MRGRKSGSSALQLDPEEVRGNALAWGAGSYLRAVSASAGSLRAVFPLALRTGRSTIFPSQELGALGGDQWWKRCLGFGVHAQGQADSGSPVSDARRIIRRGAARGGDRSG